MTSIRDKCLPCLIDKQSNYAAPSGEQQLCDQRFDRVSRTTVNYVVAMALCNKMEGRRRADRQIEYLPGSQ
jgi:hypothetical protein